MDDRGKPAISAHSIRHTYGTNLIRVGTDIVLVAELIGHNDLETTRLYTLTTEADVKAAVAGCRPTSYGSSADIPRWPTAAAVYMVQTVTTRVARRRRPAMVSCNAARGEIFRTLDRVCYGWLGDSGLDSIDAVGRGWQEPGRRDRGWYREGSWEA